MLQHNCSIKTTYIEIDAHAWGERDGSRIELDAKNKMNRPKGMYDGREKNSRRNDFGTTVTMGLVENKKQGKKKFLH